LGLLREGGGGRQQCNLKQLLAASGINYLPQVDNGRAISVLVTTRFAKPAQQFQEQRKYQLELKDYGAVVLWLMKHKT
jgi:hypothetical protein